MGASVAGPAACGARRQRSARSGSTGARERQPVDGHAVALIGTMALVVTARSPVEASATGLEGSIAHARGRGTALVALPVGATVAYAVLLVVEATVRVAPGGGWPEAVALIAGGLAYLLVAGACVASWVRRRQVAGLLFAAALAPVLAAVRALSVPLLTSLDLMTLADAVDFALGWVVLGALVWAAAGWLPRVSVSARVAAPQTELFRRVAEVTALVV